ncbi:Asp23/Gls24 family envelope stress response protein [Streptosporangium lutulentum]|uniref:Alkaline shock family protein YloU n=1 Tax=Streptosporangium lutulentum TaxID=1461250 RepID=A0ABT9QRT8_9ACTN|nr:Asp23/Gls24 family envelope stress response protein [Streptosporangium lutulentum]MDP9849462.1 putative alkaline shock family protein YloU [Streptosporangium lutulentum]
MTTPVEPRSTETPADSGDLPALPEDGTSAAAAWSAQPVRQAVPIEQRGRTDIAERVVSRIATRAAEEVARVRKVGERGPLTFRGGTRAIVDGELTAVRLDLTVEYPAPLLHVAEEVRRHVTERVHRLTGLAVGHIDIDVTNVVPPRTAFPAEYPEYSVTRSPATPSPGYSATCSRTDRHPELPEGENR